MKCIVLAAGLGTRLRPVTNWVPKPLIPVFDVPIIVRIVEQLRQNGISEIWVNLHHKPQKMIECLKDGSHLGVEIHYSFEPFILGTAGGVRRIATSLGMETFLVINGDTYRPLHLKRFMEFHKEGHAPISLLLQKDLSLDPRKAVSIREDGEVIAFLDLYGDHRGGIPCHFLGVQLMEPDVISFIPPDGYCDLREVYVRLLEAKKGLRGFCEWGYWLDVGDLRAYAKIHWDALSRNSPLKVPGREIIPGVWVEEGAVVKMGAILRGPVFIGGNARIESGATIGPYAVIGRRCSVGMGAVIRSSILWEGVCVGPRSRIIGGLVGKEFNLSLL